MDARAQSLRTLCEFLIDAFAVDDLALAVEEWDRQVAALLPNTRTSSQRDYVHTLVVEVWRRRRWTGKGGLLYHVGRARPRRQREVLAIVAALEALEPAPERARVRRCPPPASTAPNAGGPPVVSARERVQRLVLASSTVDLIALISARLEVPPDDFWAECGDLYRSIVPDDRVTRWLRLFLSRQRVAVDAWPHLVAEGRVLARSRVEVEGPALFHYCPRGRTRLPELRLALGPGRCSLSGRIGAIRYTLCLESKPDMCLSTGAER